jgi:cyclohexanone monooxygenase
MQASPFSRFLTCLTIDIYQIGSVLICSLWSYEFRRQPNNLTQKNLGDSVSSKKIDQDGLFDVIIVGAGFAGLHMLHELRQKGLSVRVYEAGDNVGGTWYWNRYPGARCDAESLAYSFSWDEDLEQDWEWSERYATQPEILKYAEHVADRFDMRKDIRFDRKVSTVQYDETANRWHVMTEAGDTATAHYIIMATGCLSVPNVPDIAGLDDFKGNRYQASLWPHEGVDFTGQHVGVIGTGSSAIQAIPVMAAQAQHLTVFQRTPNFSVPAQNWPLDEEWVKTFKKNYRGHRFNHKHGINSGFGDLEAEVTPTEALAELAGQVLPEELEAAMEESWQKGGANFLNLVGDSMIDESVNALFADFVHRKIRKTVKDPATAEALCPTTHPMGTRRICVDTDYFETYNRNNVDLVNLRETPIERITETGIQLSDRHVDIDTLVLATGFDAMTGALLRIDIEGEQGQKLAHKWEAGPRTYMGLMMAGFPNLFTITGPGSPSVLSNMMVSIELHVEFISRCIDRAMSSGSDRIETSVAVEDRWVEHVNDVANGTLYPKGGSWYMGANVPGKPRVFMPYAAGVAAYREHCDKVMADDFPGFEFVEA